MKHTPLTLLAVISLALVGCGITEAEEQQPQSAEEAQQQYKDMLESGEAQGPPPMPAGEYTAQAEAGGTIVMQIPASTDDELISQIEAYREAVNAEPVTYLTADVDNRQGHESIGMRNVYIYDKDGNEYQFSGVSEYISDIEPVTDWASEDETYSLVDGTEISRDQYFELSSTGTDLHNEHMYGASAAERKTMILVHEGTDLPNEFTRVAVQPGPFGEEVEAYPTDWNTQ